MGLPTSYGIIKKHDGELSFHNLPEKGCEFVLKRSFFRDEQG